MAGQKLPQPILVLVPQALGDSRRDSISFGKIAVDETQPADIPAPPDPSLTASPWDRSRQSRRSPNQPRLELGPILGRPHPNSLGEQLLWDRLQRDPLLRGLFSCNHQVTTILQNNYILDYV